MNGLCITDNCLLRRSDGICTTCEKEFYVAASQRVCVTFFCKTWDENNGECFSCYPNFELRGGLCVNKLCLSFRNDPAFSLPQCSSCSGNYFPFGQYCVPKFCPTFNYNPETDACIGCDFGFVYKNNSCILDNCIQFA